MRRTIPEAIDIRVVAAVLSPGAKTSLLRGRNLRLSIRARAHGRIRTRESHTHRLALEPDHLAFSICISRARQGKKKLAHVQSCERPTHSNLGPSLRDVLHVAVAKPGAVDRDDASGIAHVEAHARVP